MWSDYTVSTEGSKISEVIDISNVYAAKSTTISWVESIPTGSTLIVSVRLSTDSGVTYTDWYTCSNGASIPGITNYTTDLSNARLQFRVYMSNSGDSGARPVISNISVEIEPTDYAVGCTWVSPTINLINYDVGTASAVFDVSSEPSGTALEVYTRTSTDGENWGAWTSVASSTNTFYVDDSYLQAKVEMTSDSTRENTPVLDRLRLGLSNVNIKGVWTSPVMNLDESESLDYIEVTSSESMQAGETLKKQTRSSDDGVTFSKWYNVLPNNIAQHDADEYIQTRLIWSGASSVVDYTKVSYYDPDVESLTTLAEGLTKDYEWSMVTFNDKVYACNGKDGLFKYDGNTWSEVSTGLDVTFGTLAVHQNRLFAVGYRDSLVYFSDILDGDSWSALKYRDIGQLDGDYITGMVSFGQYLVVSKVRRKALIVGDGQILNDDTNNYNVSWLETPTGAMGHKNIVATDTALAFMSFDGIKLTNLVRDTNITNKLTDSFEKLTKGRLEYIAMAYWEDLIVVAVPSETGHNSALWTYNTITNAWSVYPDINISRFVPFNVRGQEVLYGADSTVGQLYEMFTGSLDIDTPVEYDFKSKDFTFGYPERFKLFKNFYVEFETLPASIDNDVVFYVDDEEVSTVTIPVPYGNEGDTYVARIIPPSKDVILGYRVAWRFKGRNPVKQAKLEFEVRSAIPPTLNLI